MKLSQLLIRKICLTGHLKSWKNLQLQTILTFKSYICITTGSHSNSEKAYIHTKVSNSEHNKKVIVVGGSEKKLAVEDVQLPQENETDTNEFNFNMNNP